MHRWLLSLAGLFAVALLIVGVAFWLRSRELPPVRLVVSKRTTHFLDPLKPDGTVDLASRYAPRRDGLAAWNEAAAASIKWPVPGPPRKQDYAVFCHSPEGWRTHAAWVRGSARSLLHLEAAAQADWPEISPLIDAEVRTLRNTGSPRAEQPSSSKGERKSEMVYAKLSAIRALACRCGSDVGAEPAQAARAIQTLSSLAASAGRVPDVYFAMLARTSAQEALACARALEVTEGRRLLANIVVDTEPREPDVTRWFIEGLRLRLLEAVLNAFYRGQASARVDINAMLAAINAYADRALAAGGEFEVQAVQDAAHALKSARRNPFTSREELRRLRSEQAGVMLSFSLGLGFREHVRPLETARRQAEDALVLLVSKVKPVGE